MVQGIHFTSKQNIDELIRECASTLQRVAAYRLPPAVDRRLLWLSENKEVLSPAENDELLALIDFSEDRTVEKLQANVLLSRLAATCPELVGSSK